MNGYSGGALADNMIDAMIILCACITFVLFIVMHMIVFRRMKPVMAVVWLMRCYVVSGIIGGIGSFVWFSQAHISFQDTIIVCVLCMVLYTLLVALYLFGVFSMVESSISFKILKEIADAGSKGINRQELLVQYSPAYIVRRRLARFVATGELVYEKGKYTKTKYSILSFRELLISVFLAVFPRK